MAHDNPDQQPPDRPEPTREESQSAPSKLHQTIYAVKEFAKEVGKEVVKEVKQAAAPLIAVGMLHGTPAPLHDNGNSRSHGTPRDNGAEITKPDEHTACRTASETQGASRPPDSEIGIYAQSATERAAASGPSTEIPGHDPGPDQPEDDGRNPQEEAEETTEGLTKGDKGKPI